MIYLFDPISGVKTETNYKELSEISEKTITVLKNYKCKIRKIKSLNCYIVDDKASKKHLKELREKEIIKDEIWKSIVELEGRFEISSYGRLRNALNQKLLNPSVNSKKVLGTIIRLDSGAKWLAIHKEVAKAFLFKPKGCDYAIHIGSRYNNHVDNLKWVNKKECQRYNGRSNKRSKSVYKLNAETLEILDDYDGIREAGRENYLDHKWISLAARDISKTSGGFKWCLAENYDSLISEVRGC